MATVTPSIFCIASWPVNSGVVLPLQPNHRPEYSRSAAASAMARPPTVSSPAAVGGLTRLETTIRRLILLRSLQELRRIGPTPCEALAKQGHDAASSQTS